MRLNVVNHTSSEVIEANNRNGTAGAGPVPLRGMQGFVNQENVRPRNPPLNTSRLSNGKLGACHQHTVINVWMSELTPCRCRKRIWLGCLWYADGRCTRSANHATTKHCWQQRNGLFRAEHGRFAACNSTRPFVSDASLPTI